MNLQRKKILGSIYFALFMAILVITNVYHGPLSNTIKVSPKSNKYPISDSLSHKEYVRIENDYKIAEIDSGYFTKFRSKSVTNAGLLSYEEIVHGNTKDYFIGIDLFKSDYSVEVKNTLSNTIMQYDSTTPAGTKLYGLKRVIPLRFEPSSEYQNIGKFYFPILPNYSSVATVIFWIIAFLSLVASLSVFCLWIRVIYRISKGQAFSIINIAELRLSYKILFAIVFIPMLIMLGVLWYYHNDIPSQFSYSYYTLLYSNKNYLMAGLVVAILTNAFEQGYIFRKENSLTI